MVGQNSRRIAVILVFLAGVAGAVAASWIPPVNAAGIEPVRAVADARQEFLEAEPVTRFGTPVPGGDRGASVELGVVIAPKPTGTGTPTPTTPSPTPTASTAAPTDPPDNGGDLPRTGLAIGAFVVAGATLIAAGTALRLLAPHRRPHRPHPRPRR